jgi:hypothetical protein
MIRIELAQDDDDDDYGMHLGVLHHEVKLTPLALCS